MLEPLEVLFEADLPNYALPADLELLYGGLGFAGTTLYSNFVSSIDGVVTLGSSPSAGSVISGRNPADRFVMGLLRACADAVVLGAGTLRATPGHLWTAEHVYPDLADSFVALRRGLGKPADPRLVLVTSSGELDFSHPALARGATLVTTANGAARMTGRLPASCELVVLEQAGGGEEEAARVDLAGALALLRGRGLDVVLTEGGPHLMGQLIEQGLLDEMFLTISPVLAGRDREARLGMVQGVELLPGAGAWSELLSARRHGGYLFMRYRTPARPGRA
jgi:riboflavin biosynthesis pyrimidine reductase